MKIGLIIYGSLDTLSGGYLYDRQLVASLRDQGCQVDVLILPWQDYPSHLRHNLRLAWAQEIAATHYDILLQDELNHPSLFLLNHLLRRLSSAPILSVVHPLRIAEDHSVRLMPLYRGVERAYLRSVHGFIYNSRTTRASVEPVLGGEMPHVVAYPAADHRQPPPHAHEAETVIASDWAVRPESQVVVEQTEVQPPPRRRGPLVWPWLLALLVLVVAGLGAAYLLTRDDDEPSATTEAATTAPTTTAAEPRTVSPMASP